MHQSNPSCIRCVGGSKICSYCSGKLTRHGSLKCGKLRFRCKDCRKTQVEYYSYQAYDLMTNKNIIQLTKEGVGIRSISRILKISTNTLLRRTLKIGDSVNLPPIISHQSYEVDEIKSFVKRKKRKIWIVYALNRTTRQVVSFNIGRRTNKTLNVVLDTLKLSSAKRIYTDGFPSYRYLIPKEIHSTWHHGTNHIERKNLSLRTHLKRLNRRTICFSRSKAMLEACLRIYFWG